MEFNTKSSAQSKVTDKQIANAIKEAQENAAIYRQGIVIVKVIQQLLSDGAGGKVLNKRFSDKVKAALPGVNLYIVYSGTDTIIINYGQPQTSIRLYSEGPAYLGYNFTKDIARYIEQYEAAAQRYDADILTLPTFAAEYNATINLVVDIMRKVPVLHSVDLKHRLPLMYFQGEA